MADQKFIKKQTQQLAKRLGIAQEEIVDAISQLTKGKSKKQIVAIMNDLDINKIMELKTAGIMGAYLVAQQDILLAKEFFAPITEDELKSLLIASEQFVGASLIGMGGVIKQQALSGMINNRTNAEILELIGKQGYASHSLERILNDGMNNYSRSVSAFMADSAPEDTKYVYIGPADEKTRPFCLEAMSAGKLTKKEIEERGWNISWVEGGGINCRHNWERAATKVETAFHNEDKAKDILNETTR